MTRVRGDGVVFRIRHRVAPERAARPEVAALAPIPEFETPAVFEATVPKPPISDQEYDLWTVELGDVDVGVSELWVQQFRFRGSARAHGAFRLKPARSLWVGPAELELGSGRLSAGAETVAENLEGRIDCQVSPFDVRVPEGRQVLRQNLDADPPARLGSHAFGRRLVRPAGSQAPGRIRTWVAVRAGQRRSWPHRRGQRDHPGQ